MKINIVQKGPMVLTGSKVLKLIMDSHTPPVDLFTREVIQNCADAILDEKDFGIIRFTYKNFDIDKFCSSMHFLPKESLKQYYNSNPFYLSIADSNTCGLLGTHLKEENGNNNLFNLVYDVMNSKDDENAGGSWGVGKSIYYRYGNGICFYYSRTFEKGTYISKLAGALIQNEKDNNCLLGNSSSGIAFFGDTLDGQPAPIYDDKIIDDFLKIFGLSQYTDDKTGTIVIIPFFQDNLFIEENNNKDEDVQRYWLSSLKDCLKMSIQRWYFPRLNNEKYNGKSIKVAINGEKVELNHFYQKLQDLYNGDLSDSSIQDIISKKMNGVKLGTFIYKLFDKDELGINTPPYNYPSPKFLVDSNYSECDEKGLLFYARKPGMIINYNNQSFGEYIFDQDKFLIGVFKLEDETVYQNEKLGHYVRATEVGNHALWQDGIFKEHPYMSSKKPIQEFSKIIKKHLNEVFKQNKAVVLDGGNTYLQKKFGDKLLPPSGFGNKPESPHNHGGGSGGSSSKSEKILIEFLSVNQQGYFTYNIEFTLKSKKKFLFTSNVKAGSKTYSFNKWLDLNFNIPFELKKVEIYEFYINKQKQNYPQNLPVDNNFSRRRKKIIDDVEIYKIKGFTTDSNTPSGFEIINVSDAVLKMRIMIQIKVLDNKYLIGFDASIKEAQNEK